MYKTIKYNIKEHKNTPQNAVLRGVIALVEREGFEPPDLLQSAVFKTAALDHSAISLCGICLFFSNVVQR